MRAGDAVVCGLVAPTTEIVRGSTWQRGAFEWDPDDGVYALIDHDEEKLIAATRVGTMRLFEERDGLHFELSPATHGAMEYNAWEHVRRGRFTGASLTYTPIATSRRADGIELIHRARIREVSLMLDGTPKARSTWVRVGWARHLLGVPSATC